MFKKLLNASVACAFLFAAVAMPVSFDFATMELTDKAAFAKKDKSSKKDKACSRDQNCNDGNENRKDADKSKKGGKSEENKGKGKKK